MVQLSTRYKILQVFFYKPLTQFGIREISRISKVSHPSVMRYFTEFEKEGLIKKGPRNSWMASRNDHFFLEKKLFLISQLYKIGLIKYLKHETLPKTIVLFGSASKGEDVDDSDIDLFIEGTRKDLNIAKYERITHRKINLIFGQIKNLDKTFINTLINGILLLGGIEI